jgi:hypothetical protein
MGSYPRPIEGWRDRKGCDAVRGAVRIGGGGSWVAGGGSRVAGRLSAGRDDIGRTKSVLMGSMRPADAFGPADHLSATEGARGGRDRSSGDPPQAISVLTAGGRGISGAAEGALASLGCPGAPAARLRRVLGLPSGKVRTAVAPARAGNPPRPRCHPGAGVEASRPGQKGVGAAVRCLPQHHDNTTTLHEQIATRSRSGEAPQAAGVEPKPFIPPLGGVRAFGGLDRCRGRSRRNMR